MMLKMWEKVFKLGDSWKGKLSFKDGYLFIVYIIFSGQVSILSIIIMLPSWSRCLISYIAAMLCEIRLVQW